jgi:hypothetical protein
MGAPHSFECRRQELFEMSQQIDRTTGGGGAASAASISDEEVVASFVDSVKPNGFVMRFLQLAQLALRIDDAVSYRCDFNNSLFFFFFAFFFQIIILLMFRSL